MILAVSLACNPAPGETLPPAYVAPATVNVRSQLNQQNSTVSVLKHGEKVGIVDIRRRYVKIRTRKGTEGWVDSLDLLSPDEMRRIERDRQYASTLPSEGAATAYEALNIHLDPNRRSPAFAQIPEGGPVSVLTRKLAPRVTATPRSSLMFDRPNPPSKRQRKSRQARVVSKRPPMPPPPRPPANWQEVWGLTDRVENSEAPANPPKAGKKSAPARSAPSEPVVMEAWTLIRTANHQTGWVLSRNLMMSIPDDVAQYAAGKHITAYFDLGTVNDDRDGQKHNWLWTTASVGSALDFDSWRVFLWNRRRHRFETSYRQRDLDGYFPVIVDPPNATSSGRVFSLITKDDDGRFRRRSYLFDGTRVHLTKTEDYQPGESNSLSAKNTRANSPQSRQPGWLELKWMALKKRFAGKG